MNSIAVHTPIGWFKVSEDSGFITGITYITDNICFEQHPTELLENAKKQLGEYFEGIRQNFDLPVRIEGSEFVRAVLTQLAKVPYGQTVSYGQLAAMCGHPKAARAAGTAMRKNPVAIVLPCHRVVQSDGKLGNYSAGGTANKDWLLTFEKQNSGGGLPMMPLLMPGNIK